MSEIDGWLWIIEIIRPTLLQGIDHPRFRGVGKENGGHYNLHPESSKERKGTILGRQNLHMSAATTWYPVGK
jgi:hypothetical protein